MTNHGDDCYFYYYSTCTKGDSCPFRHCEAAMGNETVCNLWQEGRCFRTVCKFRHMEIKKNRKEIPCYWEKQPAGCQKPHCAFYHEKSRYIDGVYVPPSKGLTKNEDQPNEEPAPPPPAPLPTAANPQLRGVMKAETQETVPSPTHPPVVINPADDDEDEDDQFSEEGEDGKVAPDGSRLTSPRKLPGGPTSDESLNFGVSTLGEIRLRKALKASMKRAGYPIQSADNAANGEKENIRSFCHPALYEARDDPVVCEETGRPRGSVAERLGKKIFSNDAKTGGDPLLKRSLAERLGRVVDEEDSLLAPQKALKPVRERLGLSAEPAAPTQPAETNMGKTPEQIHIKTLEEIRQEKASKSQSQSQKDCSSVLAPETTTTKTISTKASKGTKRAITIKDASIVQVKTFSEILHAKKKKQEEQQKQENIPSPKKAKQAAEKAPGKTQGQSDTALPSHVAPAGAEVKVKTLEEIRREKAARIQAEQALEAENGKSPGIEAPSAKKPRLLRNKPASLTGSITTQKIAEVTEKPVNAPTADAETSPASSNGVKVKTFEEIMREKRLRKQEMEEQASSTSQSKGSAEAEPPQKQAAGPALKRKGPIRASLTPPATSSPSSTTLASDTTTSTQKAPVRKLITLKPNAALPIHSTTATTAAAIPAVTSVSVKQSSPPRQAEADSRSQSPSSSRDSPAKNRKSSAAPSSAPKGPPAEDRTADKTQNSTQKKSPGQTTDTKVRPKLNVKPSVMKPAAQVKPGQKRKAAERSAVAAVKPLNSASTVPEEPLQETACKQREIFPSSSAEAQLSPAVPRSPTTLLGSGSDSSPLREELQTVPVFQQSPVQTKPTISTAAAREAVTVPQSPVPKTPTQSKPRRPSVAASRTAPASSAAASTSAVDDFEELMNEFTDDHLEEDMDPGMGEDDLLQELSEMIDS
ncbi:zinc finger CCCH domain-containing protein 11A isoform X1 [Centroberyx gerrardi]|uniref:zinc finger CCCH domain-containing protein 11A n=1 Tax=Centroberyx gerrardi TaxID=166262 RepID=UPI003AAF726A